MNKVILTISAILLFSCNDNIEDKSYKDPITGEAKIAKTVTIEGWDVSVMDNGSLIILSKNNQVITGVGEKENSRNVTIFSPKTAFGAVNMIDDGKDLNYESITYSNGVLSTTDISLNGVQDGVINLEKKSLLANYNGKLYPVESLAENIHIVVEGKKIPVVYKYDTYTTE